MTDQPQLTRLEWTGPLVGTLVRAFREKMGWTQETLAEIAGLTVRTVQRTEAGQLGSADTRRALARAFEVPNLDLFVVPLMVPSEEGLKEETGRLERETVVLKLTPLASGRQLRQAVEDGQAFQFDLTEEPPEAAGDAFAALCDYARDYGDIHTEYSEVEKREVDADLGRLMSEMDEAGWAVGIHSRTARLRSQSGGEPFTMEIVYLIAAPANALPEVVRVSRSVKFN